MLNSQNYARDPEVINVGEVIASEVDLKDPRVKVYYHRIKGAQTHMPDGAAIKFLGGMFATSNKEIQAFLDKIADKPGTQVYTDKGNAKAFDVQLAQLADEATKPAGNALEQVGKGAATGEMMALVQEGLRDQQQAPSMSDQAAAVAGLKEAGISAEVVPNLFKK